MQLCASKCRNVDEDHVERDRSRHDHSQASQHFLSVGHEHAARTPLTGQSSVRLEKCGSLIEIAANIKSYRTDDQTEQERNTPAPAVERLGCQRARKQRSQNRTEKHCQALADHLPRTIKATPPRRRALGEKGGGAGELTAGRKSLQ